MKISASIARLAIAGRTPSEADLIDRISSFAAKDPHSFLGSGAFLALGRRLAAAGVEPVDGEQVDITPYAGSITVEEAKAALLRTAASSVCERVALVVAEQAQLPVGGISPTTILDKIGFDSLGLIELVLALEERFEIDIPEDMKELETVKTVEDITKVVERVLAQDTQRVAEVIDAAFCDACHDQETGFGKCSVHTTDKKPTVNLTPAEHTQLGLPSIPQQDMAIDHEEQLLRELIELFRATPISNHPTVSEQWAKLVLSRYHLTPRD